MEYIYGELPTKTYLEQLIVLQKKAVRIIANADFREHSLPLFRQLGILPLSKLHEYCFGSLCIVNIII